MQGDEQRQWQDLISKGEHTALQEPEAPHHERLAVLAVQIAPELKKDVLKLAHESGLSVDQFVNGFVSEALKQAVSAAIQPKPEHVEISEKPLEGFNSVLAKVLHERENPVLEAPAR